MGVTSEPPGMPGFNRDLGDGTTVHFYEVASARPDWIPSGRFVPKGSIGGRRRPLLRIVTLARPDADFWRLRDGDLYGTPRLSGVVRSFPGKQIGIP